MCFIPKYSCLVGRTIVGSKDAIPCPDIPISGTGVERQHCYIDNQDGVITLIPVAKQCSVDGVTVSMATRLAQGKVNPTIYNIRSVNLGCL